MLYFINEITQINVLLIITVITFSKSKQFLFRSGCGLACSFQETQELFSFQLNNNIPMRNQQFTVPYHNGFYFESMLLVHKRCTFSIISIVALVPTMKIMYLLFLVPGIACGI